MERTKISPRKGKEFHWHWQRKGNRKRWKRWCEIIRTGEHTENSKSVLDLWENTGHQDKDCWVNLGRWPQQQSQGHSNCPGKGSDAKGKSGKGGGKKGNSKDAGALVWNQQPSPVASSVASSTPQTETSTTVGTIDAIECTALDLCATALTQQEIVSPRWIALNVDTGAGRTVWPMNADYACKDSDGFVFVVKVLGDTYCK